jgi:hypothetical protein
MPEASRNFVIRMSDGRYFAAKHAQTRRGEMRYSQNIEEATRFTSRWLALAVCSQGAHFAGAAILPYLSATEAPETPPAGAQRQQ